MSNIAIHAIAYKHSYGELRDVFQSLSVQLGPDTNPQLFAMVCHTAKPEAQRICIGCHLLGVEP